MTHRTQERTTVRQITFAALLIVFGLVEPMLSFQRDPSERQTVKVDDLLVYQLPKGWMRSSETVSDLRCEWTKGDTKLFYIQGQTGSGNYSDRRRSWMNDYEETTTRIGGQKANVRSFSFSKDGKKKFVAELNIGNWDKNQVQFFMHVEGRDAGTVELAKEIFNSVKMTLPAPERSTPQ